MRPWDECICQLCIRFYSIRALLSIRCVEDSSAIDGHDGLSP